MSIDKRLDCYEVRFSRGEEDALIAEVNEMEENSSWVHDLNSSAMELTGMDGPMFAKSVSDDFHLDYDLTLDTADNGTGLALSTGCSYELVRDTARSSLYETAKLNGSALGRMCPSLLAETLNNGLSVAKGTTLMLLRYGKASALHSNAEGGYQVMPISDLLRITMSMIQRRFGTGDFIEGFNSHGYTYAIWELPDAQQKILQIYQNAIKGSGSRYPVNYVPAIRFASSDTAASCATLEPVFYVPKTNTAVRFVEGVRVRHTKRGGESAMDVFENEAEDMYARFEESAEAIKKLAFITIEHGCNAVVSLCNKFAIAKKYGEAARIEMERLTAGNQGVSAHDLYICMTEAVAEAERCKASPFVTRDLEEKISKILKVDWSEHDVGGIVAWGQKT